MRGYIVLAGSAGHTNKRPCHRQNRTRWLSILASFNNLQRQSPRALEHVIIGFHHASPTALSRRSVTAMASDRRDSRARISPRSRGVNFPSASDTA